MELNNVPNFIEKIQQIFSKYGYLKILLTFVLCVVMFLIGAFAWKLSKSNYVDSIISGLTERSENLDNYRRKITPQINSILDKALIETGADRIYIFEYHNGTNSLIGVPFLYADMTYERYRGNVLPSADEFAKLNTSKYPIFNYLSKSKYWIGPIDELIKIDSRFAVRLKTEGIRYVFIYTMPINNLGCSIIAFDNSELVFTTQIKNNIRYNQGVLNHAISKFFENDVIQEVMNE